MTFSALLAMPSDFASVVRAELTDPILDLCRLFADEKAHDQFTFFSGILNLLHDPDDEEMVLTACIELSKCAFLGYEYSLDAQLKIDAILERAINLSHTMSASNLN